MLVIRRANLGLLGDVLLVSSEPCNARLCIYPSCSTHDVTKVRIDGGLDQARKDSNGVELALGKVPAHQFSLDATSVECIQVAKKTKRDKGG